MCSCFGFVNPMLAADARPLVANNTNTVKLMQNATHECIHAVLNLTSNVKFSVFRPERKAKAIFVRLKVGIGSTLPCCISMYQSCSS